MHALDKLHIKRSSSTLIHKEQGSFSKSKVQYLRISIWRGTKLLVCPEHCALTKSTHEFQAGGMHKDKSRFIAYCKITCSKQLPELCPRLRSAHPRKCLRSKTPLPDFLRGSSRSLLWRWTWASWTWSCPCWVVAHSPPAQSALHAAARGRVQAPLGEPRHRGNFLYCFHL